MFLMATRCRSRPSSIVNRLRNLVALHSLGNQNAASQRDYLPMQNLPKTRSKISSL